MISTKALPFNKFRVTFTLDRDHPPGQVSVVGCFNGWSPGSHRMRNRPGGVRSAAVVLPAGSTVSFRYVTADGLWADDPDVTDRDDDGNATITV